MSKVHLNIDIETLGQRENCVITTIACVPFKFEEPDSYDELILKGFYVKFHVPDQIKNYGRSTDADTLNWWKRQPEEAKDFSIRPSEDDVSFRTGLDALREFIGGCGYDFRSSFVWSRGNYFDFPKLDHAYLQLGEVSPWNTFRVRDTRTMIDVLTGSVNGDYTLRKGNPDGYVKHHALHDAALESCKMLEIYHNIQNGE